MYQQKFRTSHIDKSLPSLPTHLPLEVLVVEVVVLVEPVEEVRELLGPREVVHVDVRALGRGARVVLGPRTHRDRDQVVPEMK